jgi:hypothetical protein
LQTAFGCYNLQTVWPNLTSWECTNVSVYLALVVVTILLLLKETICSLFCAYEPKSLQPGLVPDLLSFDPPTLIFHIGIGLFLGELNLLLFSIMSQVIQSVLGPVWFGFFLTSFSEKLTVGKSWL